MICFQIKMLQRMIRKILLTTFYAFLTFCILSYFSVMVSLLKSVGKPGRKPVTNLGFPFKYYYQFWLSGSDSPNCGWNLKYFFIDGILTWIVVFIVYMIINIRKTAHINRL